MFSTEVSCLNVYCMVLQDVYSIVYTDRQRLLEVEVFSCTSDQVRETEILYVLADRGIRARKETVTKKPNS
jgi:hypothetical protein